MGKENHFIDRMLLRAELPGEQIPGQLLVELIGHHRVLIENHLGVICYDPMEVCVRAQFGCLRIGGTELLIAQMTKHRIIVTGNICSVQLM